MSEEAKPPRLVVPITLALCTGTLACIGSSRDAQILGAVGFCLGLVFTLSLPPVVARCAVRPGTKKNRTCALGLSDSRGRLLHYCTTRRVA